MYSHRVRYTAVGVLVVAAAAVTSSVGPAAQADPAPAVLGGVAAAPALSATVDPWVVGAQPQSLTSFAHDMATSAMGGLAGGLTARAISKKSSSSGVANVQQGSGDSQFDAPTN